MRLYTPDYIHVDTPVKQINDSFDIAVELVDLLRRKANEHYGFDGYYGVADEYDRPIKCPTYDPRDWEHVNKMYSYLWGDDESYICNVSRLIFDEQLHKEDNAFMHEYGRNQHAIHVAQYSKYASDFLKYIGREDLISPGWGRLVGFTDYLEKYYITLNDGLLECSPSDTQGGRGNVLKTIWTYYVGEPEHFPATMSLKSKPLAASMMYCGLLKEMAKYANAFHMPHKDKIIERFEKTYNMLQTFGYSETRGYYYLMYDDFTKQWYFSTNGGCEQSREMLCAPYFADEVSEDRERRANISRPIYSCAKDDGVFPMPISYPYHSFYGPYVDGHYGGIPEHFVFGGSWDNSYHNCANLLSTCGYVQIICDMVRRRSEAACRDGDFIEWYYRDGSVRQTNTTMRSHRPKYGISATAHIATIVESLFGIRPVTPGFETIRLQPAFPYAGRNEGGWINNAWNDRDISLSISMPRHRRLDVKFRYNSNDKTLHLTANGGMDANVRIPVYNGSVKSVVKGGLPISYKTERIMDTQFVFFNQKLDGKETIISLD